MIMMMIEEVNEALLFFTWETILFEYLWIDLQSIGFFSDGLENADNDNNDDGVDGNFPINNFPTTKKRRKTGLWLKSRWALVCLLLSRDVLVLSKEIIADNDDFPQMSTIKLLQCCKKIQIEQYR